MRFDEVRAIVGATPWMAPERGRLFYDHIRHHRPQQVLELGIGHGAGSCYLATALHENGEGHLTCVDLIGATYIPSAEEMLARAGLSSWATIHRERSSYTWFLKRRIEERTPPGGVCQPEFGLCYIDGPKNWTIDGAAFFMVDKLLLPNGWVVFDDYDWVYAAHDPDERPDLDDQLSPEEQRVSHVEAIFRLLVTQHPAYDDFQVDANKWAWAHKAHRLEVADATGDGAVERTVRLTYAPDLRFLVYMRLRALYKRLVPGTKPS
jgi:predicted O-methyltransferase YrrM